MLGYVKTNSCNLRVRDVDCYNMVYCSLCRHMGKCTGQCSRLTLSYDITLLSVFRLIVSGEAISPEQFRCIIHPAKKRTEIRNSPALFYCSYASSLLSYWKLKDDVSDEKGFKKWRAIVSLLFLRPAFKKAEKQFPVLSETIRTELTKMSEAEKKKDFTISELAECFGRILGEIFSCDIDAKYQKIAYLFGEIIGKWIYIFDAVDDYPSDKKKKRFNPIHDLNAEKELLYCQLTELSERASELITLLPNHPMNELNEIISNIVNEGMPSILNSKLKEEKNGKFKSL